MAATMRAAVMAGGLVGLNDDETGLVWGRNCIGTKRRSEVANCGQVLETRLNILWRPCSPSGVRLLSLDSAARSLFRMYLIVMSSWKIMAVLTVRSRRPV